MRFFSVATYAIRIISFCGTIIISADAQNIAQWEFENTNNGVGSAFNTVSEAKFSSHVPVTAFQNNTEYYGIKAWPQNGQQQNSFIEFTLTPNAGQALNLAFINFRMKRANPGVSAQNGPSNWSIRSSADNFTTDIASGNVNHAFTNYTVNPGLTFASYPFALTFRIYAFNTGSTPGGQTRVIFDYIQVTGLGVVLPIKIESFLARATTVGVSGEFSLMNTEPGSRYSVERSVDGRIFTEVYSMVEVYQHDHARYPFTDLAISNEKKLFYRLRIDETGGGKKYSAIVAVESGLPATFKSWNSFGNLVVRGEFEKGDLLNVTTVDGKNIFSRIVSTGGEQSLSFSLPYLQPGLYVVSVGSRKRKWSGILKW